MHLRAGLACAEHDARLLHDEVVAFQRDERYAALRRLACVAEPRLHVGAVGEAMEAAVQCEFQASTDTTLITLAQVWTHLHALDGALFENMTNDRVHLGRAISRAFAHVPGGVLSDSRNSGVGGRMYRLRKRE